MTKTDNNKKPKFKQYKSTPLYQYSMQPTLLFWCTASTLPTTPFNIQEAWTTDSYEGYYLFVKNPPSKLADFYSFMNNHKPPKTYKRGFVWAKPSLYRTDTLPVTQDKHLAESVSLGFASSASSGSPLNLLLKAKTPVTIQPETHGDASGFYLTVPAGIPHAYPPLPQPGHTIRLTLLGPEVGGSGFFTFQAAKYYPPMRLYVGFDVPLHPFDAKKSIPRTNGTYFRLVPTEQPFPAYTLQPYSGADNDPTFQRLLTEIRDEERAFPISNEFVFTNPSYKSRRS